MKNLFSIILFFCFISFLNAEVVAPNGAQQLVNYRTSWIGNSFGGMKDGKGCWVQQDIAAMCVTPDGTVYTDVPWEEGGGNCSMYKDGKMLGSANHTHGWGFNGGSAVAANEKYVFIALSGNNENGGLNDLDTWPPKGFKWYGVSRRFRNDFTKGAPFEHGKGGKGDTLPKSYLVVNEVPIGEKNDNSAAVTGLWADEQRLYLSNPYKNCIEIYDAETMKKQTEWDLSKWNFSQPGQIAADSFGNIWIYHTEKFVEANREHAFHSITQFNYQGEKMNGRVSDNEIISAVGPFCFGPDNRMFVFHGVLGIIVYPLNKDGNGLETKNNHALSLIGLVDEMQGSMLPLQWRWSEFGDLRFRANGVNALGCDAAGNLYIAQDLASNGGGTVLESYRLTDKTKELPIEGWGKRLPKSLDAELNWRLYGLCFIDCATLDPDDETIAYTKEEKIKLDWSKTEPGSEWTYLARTTTDSWSDPRFRVKDSGGVWARRINNEKFLFVNDMNSRWLQIYRLPPDNENINNGKNEIATPSLKAFFAGRKADFADGEPQNRPKDGVAWIYSTTPSELSFYSLAKDGKPEPSAQGWWVDADANVWRATETQGIYRFTNPPSWSYENRDIFPHPAEFKQVKRIRYDIVTDTLYLGGCAVVDGAEHKNQHWKPMGAVVCRYDNFLNGKEPGKADGKLRWKIVLPYVAGSKGHESSEPMGFDIAGDYLFVPYTGASKEAKIKTGHVEVYRLDDGKPVGWMEPDQATVGEVGLQDMRECLSAHRLKSGEYIIFLEDDYKAKVVMYRWKP